MDPEKGVELTQSGYEFYPFGLANIVRKVCTSFKGDIFITENGVAVSDDARRIAYINEATAGVVKCIEEGYPIKGYLYWSLLDNFEWMLGYGITFGLISVDRQTMVRSPKASLAYLGSLIEKS